MQILIYYDQNYWSINTVKKWYILKHHCFKKTRIRVTNFLWKNYFNFFDNFFYFTSSRLLRKSTTYFFSILWSDENLTRLPSIWCIKIQAPIFISFLMYGGRKYKVSFTYFYYVITFFANQTLNFFHVLLFTIFGESL